MNKKIIFVGMLILIAAFSISGCSALKATDTAKAALTDYYGYYNDEKIDKCIDMLDDGVIDDLGSMDDTETIYYSRRYLLGEVEEFNLQSFDSDGNFNQVSVVLEVSTKYENCDNFVNEQYVFSVSGDDVMIIGFELDPEPVPDQMIKEYFESYTDLRKVQNMYIPYVIGAEGLFDKAAVQMQADYAYASGGNYKSHEITDFYYNYQKLDWGDDIYYIMQLYAGLKFENEDFSLYAEISRQDNKVRFNYLEYYPKSAYEVLGKYYDNLKNGNTRAILNMYAPGFFEISTMTADEWEKGVLKVYASDYGKMIDYSISSWDYSIISYNNQDIEVYGFYVTTEFEGGVFDEYILIAKGETERAIVGHQIN